MEKKEKKKGFFFCLYFISLQRSVLLEKQKCKKEGKGKRTEKKEKVKNWIFFFFFIPYLTAIISPFRKINVSQRKKIEDKKKERKKNNRKKKKKK